MIPIARPQMGEEEKQRVWEAMDSGTLAQGPRVAEFETAFASMVGVPHAVATSSGSTISPPGAASNAMPPAARRSATSVSRARPYGV